MYKYFTAYMESRNKIQKVHNFFLCKYIYVYYIKSVYRLSIYFIFVFHTLL